MGRSSKEVHQAEGQLNALTFDPDKLTLVEDPSHPLYDSRVHNSFDEATVLGMMTVGVIEPIIIVRDTETEQNLVVAGRQRVINLREANRRLRELGREPHLIPAMVRRASADPMDLMVLMVMENEHRTQDTPVGRAQKMAAMADRGAPTSRIAAAFRVTEQTVTNSLRLLECCKPVRDALDAGKINATHAKALHGLPVPEQRAKLAELIEAGSAAATPRERAQRQNAVVTPAKPKMRTRAEIIAMRDEQDPADTRVRGILNWVLGEA